MAAPVLQSYSTAAPTGAVASITPAAPTGVVAGDLLVAVIVSQTARTVTPPAGWTDLTAGGVLDPSGTGRLQVYHKIAAGSDSYTWTVASLTSQISVVVARITGHDPTTPLPASEWSVVPSDGVYDATHDSPAITTTGPDRLALRLIGVSIARTVSAYPNTAVGEAAGDYLTALARLDVPSAGSVAAATWTLNSGHSRVVVGSIAVAPAGGSSILPIVHHHRRMRGVH